MSLLGETLGIIMSNNPKQTPFHLWKPVKEIRKKPHPLHSLIILLQPVLRIYRLIP